MSHTILFDPNFIVGIQFEFYSCLPNEHSKQLVTSDAFPLGIFTHKHLVMTSKDQSRANHTVNTFTFTTPIMRLFHGIQTAKIKRKRIKNHKQAGKDRF